MSNTDKTSRAEQLTDAITRNTVDTIISLIERTRNKTPTLVFNTLRILLVEKLIASVRADGLTYEFYDSKNKREN